MNQCAFKSFWESQHGVWSPGFLQAATTSSQALYLALHKVMFYFAVYCSKPHGFTPMNHFFFWLHLSTVQKCVFCVFFFFLFFFLESADPKFLGRSWKSSLPFLLGTVLGVFLLIGTCSSQQRDFYFWVWFCCCVSAHDLEMFKSVNRYSVVFCNYSLFSSGTRPVVERSMQVHFTKFPRCSMTFHSF